VPVTNARFAKKAAPTSTAELPEAPTFPTAMTESEMPPPQPAPVRPAAVVDFGRRGFSPPIDRPEAPPPPVVAPPPAPPPPVAVAPAPPPPTPPESAPAEGAQATTSEPVAQATPTAAAPNGIFRALRSVLPGHQAPPGANPPPNAPPPIAPPPGAEPPPPEQTPAPDAK
jgi:hypothetical protein